jgi:hypothetical protein
MTNEINGVCHRRFGGLRHSAASAVALTIAILEASRG